MRATFFIFCLALGIGPLAQAVPAMPAMANDQATAAGAAAVDLQELTYYPGDAQEEAQIQQAGWVCTAIDPYGQCVGGYVTPDYGWGGYWGWPRGGGGWYGHPGYPRGGWGRGGGFGGHPGGGFGHPGFGGGRRR